MAIEDEWSGAANQFVGLIPEHFLGSRVDCDDREGEVSHDDGGGRIFDERLSESRRPFYFKPLAGADVTCSNGDPVFEFDDLYLEPFSRDAVEARDGKLSNMGLAGFYHPFVVCEKALGAVLWKEFTEQRPDHLLPGQTEHSGRVFVHEKNPEIDDLCGGVAHALQNIQAIQAGLRGSEETPLVFGTLRGSGEHGLDLRSAKREDDSGDERGAGSQQLHVAL